MKVQNFREMGAVIRQARISLGLSQAELGRLVGVHQPKISEIEQGRTGVGFSLVLQVINALDLVLDVSPKGTAQLPPSTTSQQELDELDAVANTGLRR